VDREQHELQVELVAMAIAQAFEEAAGAKVLDVVADTARCTCLDGTLVFSPRLYPKQPNDLVWLVGADLHRYMGLFEAVRFEVWEVPDLDAIDAAKENRWHHLDVGEVCTCEPGHEDWDACPVASADQTLECDRGCHGGCDWVLYPQHGHAWLTVHGTDIDLGPVEDDHTEALTGRLIADLRL
jgi:hypothetical protein